MSQSKNILEGAALIAALTAASSRIIRVYALTKEPFTVRAIDAVPLLRGSWRGRMRRGHVVHVREYIPTPKMIAPWQQCWRTTRAAVLPPPVDWNPRCEWTRVS